MRHDRIVSRGAGPQFSPQCFDMCIHRAIERRTRVIPRRRHQLIAIKHPSGCRDQRGEQTIFIARQVERRTSINYPAPHFIVLPHVRSRRAMRWRGDRSNCRRYIFFARSTQDGAYASRKFTRTERLRDIIIRAKFESDNFIHLATSCRQKNHRDACHALQFAADIEAAHIWQTDVEHHERDRVFRRRS